jgi:hypothetical protein
MSDGVEVVFDNSYEWQKFYSEALEKSLAACGSEGVRVASLACPVDTGLLRNSIAYALDGQAPSKRTVKQGKRHKDGTPVSNPRTEVYTDTAPAETDSKKRAVYVGTGVEYASLIEGGRSNQAPQGFLVAPIQANGAKFKAIFEKYLGVWEDPGA